MDPNENIRQQNELRLAFARATRDGVEVDQDDMDRLAELDEALTQWLYYGGFAPTIELLDSAECARIVAAEQPAPFGWTESGSLVDDCAADAFDDQDIFPPGA